MRRYVPILLGVVLCVGPVRAEAPGRTIEDSWDAAYLQGAKTGFFHTTVREVERDGAKFFQATVEMDLRIKRYNATVQLRMITSNEETPDGKVTAVSMTQFLDRGKQLVLKGTVEGTQLHLKVDDPPIDKKIPWNDEVIGLYRQEQLFRQRKLKPGEAVKYLSFEPSLSTVVTIHATVKSEEEVDVLQARRGERGATTLGKQRLLRVEAVPDRVVAPGANIQLPTMVSWLDKDYQTVRSEIELPIGKVVLYRTTREVATGQTGQVAKAPDIGLNALIPLNRTVERPHETDALVYRITVKGDEDVATTFAQDDRQSVKNVRGNTFDLYVRSVRRPVPHDESVEVKDEFLKSCYFLDSDDPEVQRKARLAVGPERDPWKKAQRIEAWVYRNIQKKNYTVAFATASQVAQNLEGDCRQHAVLTAAMCRAVGVPARTAVGLIYVLDGQRRPVMGFHMWTEVCVQGQWVAIDATLGRGSIGAAHIKIADSSWSDVQSLTPLLPVARILGKVSIEVISVRNAE
jgi:transglutaminase-like putative cysteine protease